MSNSLGKLFTITSFGESHGNLVGVIIDGCPAGLVMPGKLLVIFCLDLILPFV